MTQRCLLLRLVFIIVAKLEGSITCLSCTEVARPSDCQYVQECGSHEKCSIESYLTVLGDIRYNVSCMDRIKCTAAGRKRNVLNATVLNVIQQKNDFGAVSEEQSDKNDVLLCSECCDTELCNIKGCGEEGLPPNSGLLCYACEQEAAPDKCNKITLCNRDHICDQMGVLDIGAYQLVGRRSVDMISRFQRGAVCNKCCTKNLCNLDNCTSLLTPSITVANTTQATRTLAPVNGGWSTWSHWNMCSLTCGGGHHFRVRLCNNPLPAKDGAPCSGSSKETQMCSNLPCPVNGGWSTWSHWNMCSLTCGGGYHFRVRVCNNPPPANAGAPCSGSSKETQMCSSMPCPGKGQVDGQWASWTMWSSCSVTCGTGGTSSRQRNCDNPRPSDTGLFCSGESYEIRQCSGQNGPQVIQSAHNYTRTVGSQVVMKCLEHGLFPLQQVPQVTWAVPQIVGHPLPSNLEYHTDGSLVIHGLRAENCGHYFCTLTTDCGSYNSPDFYVAIY